MTPNKEGVTKFIDVDLREIVPFIHWTFFFMSWRLNGKYDGIHTVCDCSSCKVGWLQKFSPDERSKAEEALKLYKDAQEMLGRFLNEKIVTINAMVGIYPAHSDGEDIHIEANSKQTIIPTLRQQAPSRDGFCYSLADFIKPEKDYIGVFANTVLGVEDFAEIFEKDDDMYHSILIKTLSDRLAEATAEWLHYKVRTDTWGFVPNEAKDMNEMFKTHYTGIRPAVGYPSLPDQSIIFTLDPLIQFSELSKCVTIIF